MKNMHLSKIDVRIKTKKKLSSDMVFPFRPFGRVGTITTRARGFLQGPVRYNIQTRDFITDWFCNIHSTSSQSADVINSDLLPSSFISISSVSVLERRLQGDRSK